MILNLDENTTIEELQDKFGECFPGLKIEFYKGQKNLKGDHPAAGYLTVGDLTKKHYNNTLEIKSWNKAERVALLFKEEFGLLVRLFRLHEGTWHPMGGEEELTPERYVPHPGSPAASSSGDEEDVPLSI